MDRKTLRAILENEELDTNAKISSVLTAYHDGVADAKSGLKTDEDVKKAVAEALSKAPSKVKAEELDEYKTLILQSGTQFEIIGIKYINNKITANALRLTTWLTKPC